MPEVAAEGTASALAQLGKGRGKGGKGGKGGGGSSGGAAKLAEALNIATALLGHAQLNDGTAVSQPLQGAATALQTAQPAPPPKSTAARLAEAANILEEAARRDQTAF